MSPDEILSWWLFYLSLLDVEATPQVEVVDPSGIVESLALEHARGAVRVCLNASDSRQTLALRFRAEYFGAGVQHVASATDDIFAVAEAIQAAGLGLLPIPENYHDDLEARLGLDPALMDRPKARGILYDEDEGGATSSPTPAPSRSGSSSRSCSAMGYAGYGAPNAAIRLAALSRLARNPACRAGERAGPQSAPRRRPGMIGAPAASAGPSRRSEAPGLRVVDPARAAPIVSAPGRTIDGPGSRRPGPTARPGGASPRPTRPRRRRDAPPPGPLGPEGAWGHRSTGSPRGAVPALWRTAMRIATIDGIRLHHAVSGPEDGPPVVFANSLGTDLRVWDALLPHLPPGLRVLRYDMRGHGLSDAPAGPYGMGELVADLTGLMERLGMRGALVVGLSIGGVVAQGLAAERPDLARALVLVCTAAKIGTTETWEARVEAVRQGGIEGLADAVLERWFSRRFRAERADEVAGWRHMLTRTPAEGYIGCCAALAETDLRLSTAGLRQPVLAVVGSEDGATPPDLVRETAESIPGARFELLRGAGHIPCVEQPEALAWLIGGFMEEHDLV